MSDDAVVDAAAEVLPLPTRGMPGGGLLTVAQVEADAVLMTAFFQFIAACPPHGPFLHYVSLLLCERLPVTPTTAAALCRRYFDVDHLRAWPLLYVPASIGVDDVEKLLAPPPRERR